MKSNYLLVVFIFCLFSCTKRQNVEQTVSYEELAAQKIESLRENNEGLKISDQEIYWGNDTLNSFLLSDFARQERLYFYISYNTCSPCIQECVDILERNFPDFLDKESIVFVSPDYLPRFRDNCYGKRLLGLKNESLGIPLEEESVPFFFVLDGELKIKDLHVVNKNDFKKTQDYIKKVEL